MRFDVAIIGGGIAGMSVAGELSRHAGLSVAVLEQEPQLAYHASGRSAAAFLESYGSPEIRALTRASRPLLAAVDADEPPLLVPRPLLWLAPEEQVPALERLVAAEPLVRRIDEDEARRLFPPLAVGWADAVAAEDTAADLDVAGLLDRYRRLAIRGGATVMTRARVLAGEPSGAGWRLETDGGEVTAGVVVDAAGAWADQVAGRCGVEPVGLAPLRRTVAIVTCPQAERDWPLVGDVEESFYLRPEGDGLLLSPADETPAEPGDARPTTEDIALALDRANEATTLRLRHVRRSWAGLRTFSPDRNPVVGFDPAYPGFFWLAGQGGYGMQTAPGIALLAAAAIRGEALPAPLAAEGLNVAALSPARLRA
jgi:D-arginine dehydrogenase